MAYLASKSACRTLVNIPPAAVVSIQLAPTLNIKGNLFDSAIMKTSVIMPEFRKRYLENPKDPTAFEGAAIAFDGPEDYHHRTDDPKMKIDANTMLFIRGVGTVGYPGAAEVVKPDSTIIVSRIVNGYANPTQSGDAKKAGMVFAASEPGQGRAQPGEANP